VSDPNLTPDPAALVAEVAALKAALISRPDPAPLQAELASLKQRLAAVPDHSAALAEHATLRTTLASLQADNQRLAADLGAATTTAAQSLDQIKATLADTIRERDTFSAQIKTLEPKAALAADLEIKVNGFINEKRETSLIATLKGKLPGADDLAIKGVLMTLHDAGEINRFAEDAAAEATKALPIIALKAPSLTRPPTSGGGSAGLRETTAPLARPRSLIG